MIRPRRMKRIELTVLKRDVDRLIEHLGVVGVFHPALPDADAAIRVAAPKAPQNDGETDAVAEALVSLRDAAAYLRIAVSDEPGEGARLPVADDTRRLATIVERVSELKTKESTTTAERRSLEEALSEARAFERLDAPFSDLEKLSYLTLRIGRLDPQRREALSVALGDRAVIASVGAEDRILAASSRKGRFALDSELQKAGFVPIRVPEGFTGIPSELTAGLAERIAQAERDLADIEIEKTELAEREGPTIRRLQDAYLVAAAVGRLKAGLESTASAFRLRGWVAADRVALLVDDLERLAEGRVAVRTWNPEELPSVREGREKVPVSLDHGRFVGGFQGLVFSYGAPLYGTIDPTPFVAVSFTVLFGLMFGDIGQGFVLFLVGLLAGRKSFKPLAGLSGIAPALTAVGISSMFVGLLDGEVFANETLLIRPTRAITGFLTGVPVDRILTLMPERGSLDKLFVFFGFTIAVGVVLNSIGLIINIINQVSMRRWEKAFFAKTGLAGAALFWYALFLGVRFGYGPDSARSFAWFDWIGLGLPILALLLGPAFLRLIRGVRPLLEHGAIAYFVEGFVEILESASYYLSNTVSFLRVGAFALSHAVLSFIVFALSEMVAESSPLGPLFSFFVIAFGNLVIILLEGLIVAIQVVRLQYYEFFSKFFSETGVEFAPFRFRREVKS